MCESLCHSWHVTNDDTLARFEIRRGVMSRKVSRCLTVRWMTHRHMDFKFLTRLSLETNDELMDGQVGS